MKFKKFISLVTAVALGLTASAFTSLSSSATDDAPLYKVECEDGAELSSELQVATKIYNDEYPGYSGDGFVWMQGGGTLTFNVTVPETGMYEVSTRFLQYLSEDGRMQKLFINGSNKGEFLLPYGKTWGDYKFGVYKLNEGENEIQIVAGWGYACFDTFTVDYANLDPLDVEPVLADKDATQETQSLMNYLCDMYGEKIISGQQEIYGGGNDGDMDKEFNWLKDLTGEYPAIRGFDYMNYNPLYGWEDGTTDRIIDWVNNENGIATVCWHIHVPNDFANYTLGETIDWTKATYKPDQTDFDTSNAIVEGTKEYDYVQLAIEDLATELLKLQDAGVPVIFRPYHEAEGNGPNGGAWFWWGSGGAEVYKQLWENLYTELTEKYGLHNLIWEFNSYTYSTSPEWYPGDDLVDIVAYDKYNTVYNRTDGLSGVPNEDAISSIFYNLVELTDGKKLVAMSENDTIPDIDNMTIEEAWWLYFCPWYGDYLMSEQNNYKDTLIKIYQSDYVITLDELPADLKTYKSSGDDKEYEIGDVNLDGEISIADLIKLKKHILGAETLSSKAAQYSDLNSDNTINAFDSSLLKKKIFQ